MRGMLLLTALLTASSAGMAAVEPALAPAPAVLKQIDTLGANQAGYLGEARVLGDFNDIARRFNLHRTGPRGRDYSIKMVWAPERKRALFLGANHAVPHRLNDVWEFDLGALAWVLLYAPDNPRGYSDLGRDMSDVAFVDGILVTRRGGPAVIAHTWWGLTYDPVHRQALFMNTWLTDQKKAIGQLGGDPGQRYAGPPLWAFSPESRQWRPIKTEKPWPKSPFAALLEYIPELGGAIWHTRNFQMQATWLYDPAANTWRDLKANARRGDFAHASPKPEQVAYYDPGRRLVVAQRGLETYHFDIRLREWSKVLSSEKGHAPFGHDAYGPIAFDPHSGHGLLLDMKDDSLWAYNPDRPAWTRLSPGGAPMPTGPKRLSYFDPAHGVFVVIQGKKVWAYRYRTGPRTSFSGVADLRAPLKQKNGKQHLGRRMNGIASASRAG